MNDSLVHQATIHPRKWHWFLQQKTMLTGKQNIIRSQTGNHRGSYKECKFHIDLSICLLVSNAIPLLISIAQNANVFHQDSTLRHHSLIQVPLQVFRSTTTQRDSRHRTYTVSEFHAEAQQATASEGLAQGPYVAARAGFEPMTLR